MQTAERIEGVLRALRAGNQRETSVLLDVVRVFYMHSITSAHLELVQPTKAPDGGPYILRYEYEGYKHEVFGVYVAEGKFVRNPELKNR